MRLSMPAHPEMGSKVDEASSLIAVHARAFPALGSLLPHALCCGKRKGGQEQT